MSFEYKRTIYTDLNSLILLYQNGDLPEDTLAFPYNSGPGKVSWAHRDELKKLSVLGGAYPTSNTQKGK